MPDALKPKKTGLALAAISGIIYIACAILIALAPAFTLNVFGAMFHGIDISKIAMQSIWIGRTVIGLVEIIVLAFAAGWFYAIIYNKIE